MIVVYNPASVNYTYRSPEGPVGRHLGRVGGRIETAARAQVGKDTFALAASIYSRVMVGPNGNAMLEVGATDHKAVMHHEGTKPHIITPNRVKVLKYRQGTQTVFAKAVLHPGTPANRFLTDNLRLANI